MPGIIPQDWESFTDACAPSRPELLSMLSDLYAALGSWRAVAQVCGISIKTLDNFQRQSAPPHGSAGRVVWLTWALICRPGRIRTGLDLVTCGRLTADGGPESAGRALFSGHYRARWLVRYDREMCERCELPPETLPPEDYCI